MTSDRPNIQGLAVGDGNPSRVVAVIGAMRSIAGRVSWDMLDQAISSLTNFAVGTGEEIVSRSPRVSVGLPVYNGVNYLAEALDFLDSPELRGFRDHHLGQCFVR